MANVVMVTFCLTFGSQAIRTGQWESPKTTLKEGVKVRVIHGGSQSHKTGINAPNISHLNQNILTQNKILKMNFLHANHLEAFNSAWRRYLAAYLWFTNTYAIETNHLQTRLEDSRVLHNVIKRTIHSNKYWLKFLVVSKKLCLGPNCLEFNSPYQSWFEAIPFKSPSIAVALCW